jgi:FkbM family methyltransferase
LLATAQEAAASLGRVVRKIRNVPRVLKWWTKQVPVVVDLVTFPRRARWHLLSLDIPGGLGWNWKIWSRLAPEEFHADLGDGKIYFSGTTVNADRGTFAEIFVARDYDSNYTDSIVVDVGAHKGYFGAYALLHGAKAVLSYEPEEMNFGFLERAADSFRAKAHEWRTVRAAVGSHAREAELTVMRDSWSHSLCHTGRRDETRGVQKVDVISIRDILEEAQALDGRILVKIDVEGSECEIVLGTPKESFAAVDELFIEVHAFASCTSRELMAHLEMRAIEANGVLHLARE